MNYSNNTQNEAAKRTREKCFVKIEPII